VRHRSSRLTSGAPSQPADVALSPSSPSHSWGPGAFAYCEVAHCHGAWLKAAGVPANARVRPRNHLIPPQGELFASEGRLAMTPQPRPHVAHKAETAHVTSGTPAPRRVAIKVAWPHTGGSVRNEALALAAFRHPSIIAIYALGRT